MEFVIIAFVFLYVFAIYRLATLYVDDYSCKLHEWAFDKTDNKLRCVKCKYSPSEVTKNE